MAADRAPGGAGDLFASRAECLVALSIGLYFVAFVAYGVVAQRGLVADGAWYVVEIATKRGFNFVEPGRRAAEIFYQWPAVLGVRLGVHSLRTLGRLFQIGCSYGVFASLVACWALLPAPRRPLMLFPVLSILAGWMTNCYVGMVEVNALSFWFWPVLFALLFHPLGRRRDAILLFGLSLPMLLLYPTVVLLAPTLSGVALWRWRRHPPDPYRRAWMALALWFVLVAALGAYLIAHPRDLANRNGFLDQVLALAFLRLPGQGVNWPLALALVAMPLLLLCAWRPAAMRRRVLLWLPPYLLFAAFTALAPVVALSSFAPNLQHAARTWQSLAVVLLLPPLFAHLAGRLRLAGPGRTLALVVLAILAVAQISWQIATTAQWSGRLALFRELLATRSGLVPFEDTPLASHHIGLQAVAPLDWGWTDPSLSIVLARGGQVGAIVAAPKTNGWQPFDPARPEQLPKVPGVDYSGYLAALAATRPAATP